MDNRELLRRIPAVDKVLLMESVSGLMDNHPRSVVTEAVRRVLDDVRQGVMSGEGDLADDAEVCRRVEAAVRAMERPNLRRVINATGVVVHTNLGRSVLAEEAMEAVIRASAGYSNLEYDLEAGRRGSRYSLVEDLVCELTGAESALVVNNNAAAVFLTLQTIASGREVIVSRGQLVEIGGSFRIPDVMARSGAILVEVGATNKTHLRDYESAVGERTGLLLKVHTSNFAVVGFTASVELKDLVSLGQRCGLAVMEDLGSGTLVDLSKYGLMKEPTVTEVLEDGADVVTFSGDKLLGGPQAGIIVGSREVVDPVKKNPLHRAVRVDKMTLSGLEATLRLYRDEPAALAAVPTMRMLTMPLANLQRAASSLARRIRTKVGDRCLIETTHGKSQVGGGALPLADLPTRLVAVSPKEMSVGVLEERLRGGEPPLVGRIERDRFLLDVRTILPGQVADVAEALDRALGVDD